jgi:arylsulfatase
MKLKAISTCAVLLFSAMAMRGAETNTAATLKQIQAHDRAVYIQDHWMRDPYITLAPDGWYYLTGTTGADSDGKWNNLLGWRSHDLANWEPLPKLWSLAESKWISSPATNEAQADQVLKLWAPEAHLLNGRWVIVHTTNQRRSNLLLGGAELQSPFTEPMGKDFGLRHDPSLFPDNGTNWLVYACAEIVPLKPDFSGFAGPAVKIGPADRKLGHEGCGILKIGSKYVLFGTAWSTDSMRKGTYNLYYCTADKITGPYGPRKFAGRFLGHGTPFQDKEGRWWCTAFYNANKPSVADDQAGAELADTAYTVNRQGTTIVPLDVKVVDGDVDIQSLDPRYARPGAEEVQKF